MSLSDIISKIDNEEQLSSQEMKSLLALEEPNDIDRFFKCAYRVKLRHVGSKVYLRGLIECSNLCIKDCYYCGIRKSNQNISRYQMDEDAIFKAAIWAFEQGYGSVVIQSGERQDMAFIEKIENILNKIHEHCGDQLGITLSLGEQSEDTYQRWFSAGAHRYLLRIETSSPHIYWLLHPGNHSYEERLRCLDVLQRIGYQVGTGVMIGLPHQKLDDLVLDIEFFRDHNIDMIGMGPYIPHNDTPLSKIVPAFDKDRKKQALDLGLKMLALARVVLKDVNIAATTALQALDPQGREQALLCGANVIMPNVTEPQYRSNYKLYEDKPCITEDASMCQNCLSQRIEGIGETIGKFQRGDSRHWEKRKKLNSSC